MSRYSINLTDEVYTYLQSVSLREDTILQQLREETALHKWARMQISPEQGQFMAMLLKILGAKRVIELGVFTGYSSLCMAQALPADGKIIACDINEEYTNIAKRYWEQAGVSNKIELRLAPALETLKNLLKSDEAGKFDFVFIDAVKEEYKEYYEIVLELIRPGGLIGIDNVLWSGSVADPEKQDAETIALRVFNQYLHQDERVDISMLSIGDGLTLARKR
ncbi:MAG: putative O-methyltransferase YrrM [Planctomycetota bacterium]|jgi:predicted O-methyltransferase YrrM